MNCDDPLYFRLVDYLIIPNRYNLSINVCIISFDTKGLENPDSEPVCYYRYAGSRKYIIWGKFWSEYCLDAYSYYKQVLNTRPIDEHLHVTLLDKLDDYRYSKSPEFVYNNNKLDAKGLSQGSKLVCTRAVINDTDYRATK